MKKLQMAAILVGGFVGPFTGQALAVVLPEFADTFDVSVGQAALTMSFYLFPFATMMLISGRLVRGIPPHKVVSWAYIVTLPLALMLLITPSWWLFVACYAVIGMANAFTTPVLQMMLRELTPPENLGKALGTYAAMQSLGMLSAPFVAGLSSVVNWRLTFLVTASAAAFILLARLPVVAAPSASRQNVAGKVQWLPTLIHMLSGFVVGVGVIGVGFMTSLHVGDRFELDAAARGLVVMCGGAAAFFGSRKIGEMADKFGVRAVLVVSALIAALALACIPISPWIVLVALLWAISVAAAQGIQATVNLAVLASPGGASLLSTVQAFRFFGSAAAPISFLPIYMAIGAQAFWVCAAALLVVALTQWLNPQKSIR
ncbi:MFS transporter [Corynebacterium callunae]|uniref:Major facilitator superfamily permease n=1 Tax=Corynebacterium callunae DSM 20147 TaxID=1121353 RepID=M1V004_9CORY|nr:MFS transporter [Corynebacterium callunae]AGG67478.1 major facilitator superfamily permease [Corynebacterium callunae DSM 20147]